jgi:hypothetical protein
MLLLILGLISLILIVLWNPVFEHMTNKDLKKVTGFHAQKPGHWDIERSGTISGKNKDNSNSKRPEQVIQGPKVPPIDPNEANKSSLDPNAGKNKSVYPDIFGPDTTNSPGHLESSSGLSNNNDPPSQFIGFEETTSGNAMPYLDDFSKFMK